MDGTVSADLQQETTQLLQRLIRCNTVNPPGNERVLQEGLAGDLRAAGFEVDLLGAQPERPNLVARLRGAADGPVLCLLSHVDTVLATAADWTHDPWSGDLADGFVWGRGALDMKSQTAAEVAAALSLAREAGVPRRAICSSWWSSTRRSAASSARCGSASTIPATVSYTHLTLPTICSV